ncbi:MAG: KGG domain-containing protein [Pseudomonadota bacterium]
MNTSDKHSGKQGGKAAGGRGSGTSARGFASMNPDKQRAIASEGGKAAHEKGTAHEFTPEEARRAGSMSHTKRQSAGSSSPSRAGKAGKGQGKPH